MGHRVQFPCILTSKLACDLRVVTFMCQRGLGNISSQIRRKLQESHSEVWLKKTVQYLTDCTSLAMAVKKGLINPVTFSPPPPMPTVPKHRWLMQVYAQDVLQRLTEIKAAVTSIYGRILKMDSTKKVARKLAGRSFGTATWATNVGNEHGQVIMSVLTASEGELHVALRRLALIRNLIQAFDWDNGRDTLGVPLINSARMSEIMASQAKHVACIQDPPGIHLYTRTGTILKGEHHLPTYRCARGSTFLESFHFHLNRFIPGTLASDVFFQAYLLDGLARWNDDRAVAATTDEQQPYSYNHLLRHAANSLSGEVLGKEVVPYTEHRKYTGELLGVEYLYLQTGEVLQDYRTARLQPCGRGTIYETLCVVSKRCAL
ncbi:hypothetical protein FQA47_016411 [Oryzias melastigma]|uniref:DUF6729 domain-containing protein n=1 Tax=Oryzias melastigma TaxID=30732 RepID=A0A834BKQ9_ORYME|nr:hypothetical protein FQA47_016411 [Oryzias melastigma]